MKNLTLITCFILLINNSYGSDYLKYNNKKARLNMNFPVFENPDQRVAVEKINKTLQLAELNLLVGYEKQDVFERTRKPFRGVLEGKVDMLPTITTNTEYLLSLHFNQSESYLTMYYWTTFYNFNPQNGDLIQLEDLFTDDGFKIFKKAVKRLRIATFKKHFDQKIPEELSYIIEAYEKSDLRDFYIKDNAIFIDSDNCFYKNHKFSGTRMVYRFELNQFEEYLNNYGKVLFGLANNPCHYDAYAPSCLPALYKGYVGEWPIQFYLNRPSIYSNHIRAVYVYSNYGKGIQLAGELDGNALELIERDESFDATAQISARVEGDKISGTWQSLTDDVVSYAFEVVRE